MGIADQVFMQEALVCARRAEISGEVPIGAVLVYENEIIGRGFNSSIQLNDPTAHAEMMALRAGAATIGNYRLINTTLYVTLEPCMMCVGAIVHARVKHLVFGASDPKAGAVMSQCQGLEHAFLNHRTTFAAGLMAEACAMVLRDFFRAKR